MRLLLDQHLSRKLVAALQDSFPGTTHVVLHGLDPSDDNAVWEFASREGLAITTKDKIFRC